MPGIVVKNPHANAGAAKRHKFHPWVKKIPWRRKWQPLQYSCLENSMDRGAWQAIVHKVAESDRTARLTLSVSEVIRWKDVC